MERKAAQSGGGASAAALQARYRSLGCEGTRQPRQQERLVKAPKQQRSGGDHTGALHYCVRPSDGYLFPAPQSQFNKSDYAEEALDQCRFICQDKTMALYRLDNAEQETEEMVSVETKKPYSELPTAFRYQTDEDFKSCNWSRYFAHVDEMRARTVTPRNLENAMIPTPTFRPAVDRQQVSSVKDADKPDRSAERKVRLVGPTYLPEKGMEVQAEGRLSQEHGEAASQGE
ncbi:DUF2865 domain-containing protein [Mesorhizobium sp. CAU 1732]|uniref:DUF2865 domain-containing protein n=1 Tax=Mesorhizobium sp. CAU 1732 TaxID=3140358 RepID=UPI00326076E2